MLDQKERLEKELRFLEDSLKADIITKEEYEKAKERIQHKIAGIQVQTDEHPKMQKTQDAETPPPTLSEKPKDSPVPEKTFIKPAQEEKQEQITPDEKKDRLEVYASKKKKNYSALIISVVIVLLIIILIVANLPKESTQETEKPKEIIICSSDADCFSEDKLATCSNPGTAESKCEYHTKVNLNLITDKNCPSCDTLRMISTFKQLYPGITINTIEFGDAEELVDELEIDSIPAYIFDEEITKTANFEKTKSMFAEKNNKYLVLSTASGSSYYFKRPEITNRIDLYVIAEEDNKKIEASIKEVKDLFVDQLSLEKISVNDEQKEELKNTLGATSYPFILINNQHKLNGIQSAEQIKQLFCKINDLDGCNTELSSDI